MIFSEKMKDAILSKDDIEKDSGFLKRETITYTRMLLKYDSIEFSKADDGRLKVGYKYKGKMLAWQFVDMPNFKGGEALTLHGVDGVTQITMDAV